MSPHLLGNLYLNKSHTPTFLSFLRLVLGYLNRVLSVSGCNRCTCRFKSSHLRAAEIEQLFIAENKLSINYGVTNNFLFWFHFTDYVTAFCIESGKDQLSPKEVNEAITNQVTYARKKIQRRATKCT